MFETCLYTPNQKAPVPLLLLVVTFNVQVVTTPSNVFSLLIIRSLKLGVFFEKIHLADKKIRFFSIVLMTKLGIRWHSVH